MVVCTEVRVPAQKSAVALVRALRPCRALTVTVVVLVELPLLVGSMGEGVGVNRGVGEACRTVAVEERVKRAGEGLGGVEGE